MIQFFLCLSSNKVKSNKIMDERSKALSILNIIKLNFSSRKSIYLLPKLAKEILNWSDQLRLLTNYKIQLIFFKEWKSIFYFNLRSKNLSFGNFNKAIYTRIQVDSNFHLSHTSTNQNYHKSQVEDRIK